MTVSRGASRAEPLRNIGSFLSQSASAEPYHALKMKASVQIPTLGQGIARRASAKVAKTAVRTWRLFALDGSSVCCARPSRKSWRAPKWHSQIISPCMQSVRGAATVASNPFKATDEVCSFVDASVHDFGRRLSDVSATVQCSADLCARSNICFHCSSCIGT